jgi:hypothetical protein
MLERNQYKKFEVLNDGFKHKGIHHKFSDIYSIFFSYMLVEQKLNFISAGEAERAFLYITLKNKEKIKLKFDEWGFVTGFNFDKKSDISNLVELYVFLMEKSFQYRIERFLKEISERGNFQYDDCIFKPKEQSIVFRGSTFHVSDTNFLKGYGYVEMKRKSEGLLGKSIRFLNPLKDPQFNTQDDTDCIFYILDKFYGLRWPSK